jgi:hypothetical protein
MLTWLLAGTFLLWTGIPQAVVSTGTGAAIACTQLDAIPPPSGWTWGPHGATPPPARTYAQLDAECDQGEESACVELQGQVQDYYARDRDAENAQRAEEIEQQREQAERQLEHRREFIQHNRDMINGAMEPWR